MEVILKQDVQGLGYKNDTVKVRAGYGRNFLIPNGVAIIANESNKRMMNENIRQAAHKAAKLKQDAEALAQKIGELTVEIGTKAGETGKIFGAVTPFQVADALKAKGFEVDRKKILFKEQPKQLGTYTVTLDLHKEVKHPITIKVVAE
ncbi:MAG TPA: 50S ribosomal protein L9 [Cyclobacteriaceae bacterium]|nr:50S ribosomal protein L9 [Cyclobacteriaceae bacterium]HMV09633.1 50S ribosomal protein L9 [Cyclobacteriaceae bacterium]HMV89548.1 50S ribosomal protein L9 [Cyclobacteriaceae bacterium]HMX01035.1 50S ribosomal protein L9 [Cyclobacteriaceae bacterium]HMX52011.1 50S ribosomal protein L9 [Cyclobacteriaceae bacterium]